MKKKPAHPRSPERVCSSETTTTVQIRPSECLVRLRKGQYVEMKSNRCFSAERGWYAVPRLEAERYRRIGLREDLGPPHTFGHMSFEPRFDVATSAAELEALLERETLTGCVRPDVGTVDRPAQPTPLRPPTTDQAQAELREPPAH
jgi:hypothetical protein